MLFLVLCPQGNVLSIVTSAAPHSLRREIYCATSSSIQGKSPSSVTFAAMPVEGGMPLLDIYAPILVSMPATVPVLPLQLALRGRH